MLNRQLHGQHLSADKTSQVWPGIPLKGRGSELSELLPPPPLPGRMILLNQRPGVAQKPRHPYSPMSLPGQNLNGFIAMGSLS